MEVFEDLIWASPNYIGHFKELVEKKRIFNFLAGLNKNMDEVRERILGMKPIPYIHEVFSKVRREAIRKKVKLGKSISTNNIDGSTLSTCGVSNQSNNNRPQ